MSPIISSLLVLTSTLSASPPVAPPDPGYYEAPPAVQKAKQVRPAEQDKVASADKPEVFDAKAVKLTGMEDEATTLAKQRYNTAIQEKDVARLSYESGIPGTGGDHPLEILLDACRRVLEAELELAGDARQRIAVFKKAVEVEKMSEAIAMTQLKQGVIPRHEFLRKKYARITSELLLLREEKKVTPSDSK